MKALSLLAALWAFAVPAFASENAGLHLNMTASGLGILALALFVLAYALVIGEEFIHMRKSKPVLFAGGLIWILVSLLAPDTEQGREMVENAINHNLLEYAALLLFLLTAMVYVNAMTERNIFEALRARLIKAGFSYRKLFWITGFLAFFISPVADNLTTALLMGAVVIACGSEEPRFVSLSFINIVVAANAGGAFSPFGDITTLMVWQSGHVGFFEFFELFVPALLNFVIPGAIMTLAVPKGTPPAPEEDARIKHGGLVICFLFLATIVTAVTFEQVLHMPPFLGMMFGLSYLFLFAFYLKKQEHKVADTVSEFNIFNKVARAEWDTLLFFFGVIFCVGGLGTIGYLAYVSHFLYDGLGATSANVVAGLLSAVVDNIPVMFAILTMNPDMETYQWLLVTMTAGVGGSLLSVGSAAGVALMGQSKGRYTFFSHLKWSWAVGLGYAVSIWVHLLMSS
ncbi:sodium:proton antiporter NhaD [Marinobacteraceae bacterium S3BR75-40.1]